MHQYIANMQTSRHIHSSRGEATYNWGGYAVAEPQTFRFALLCLLMVMGSNLPGPPSKSWYQSSSFFSSLRCSPACQPIYISVHPLIYSKASKGNIPPCVAFAFVLSLWARKCRAHVKKSDPDLQCKVLTLSKVGDWSTNTCFGSSLRGCIGAKGTFYQLIRLAWSGLISPYHATQLLPPYCTLY